MPVEWRNHVSDILTPRENKNSNSTEYWREKIFYNILFGGVILGAVILIPSIISCIEDKLYIQVFVDLTVFIVVGLLLFDKRIPYNIKSGFILFTIYSLAVSLILTKGPYASGFIYLVSFSIIASVWRGTKWAIISIIINIITLSVIGYLSYSGIISIKGFSSYNITKWISLGSNLFLANALSSISVGLLLDGLEKTINNTIKLKNQLSNEQIKLIEAKQKAEEADHLKTAFLANMSHELKTPLNSIIGFSNLILEEEIKEIDKIYKYQKIIAEGGDMLLGLINDILDISVIESGQLKFIKQQIPLKNIVNDISNIFDYRLIDELNKNIKFNIKDDIKNDDFYLMTDPLRLKQVIINLIKNALKFTDTGEINLSFELFDNNQYLLFKVQDTGIGIPEEKLSEVFDRFTKLEEPTRNFISGTGLGLAISKEIVELLGGKIWVESTQGKGSTFYFTVQAVYSEEKLPIEVS